MHHVPRVYQLKPEKIAREDERGGKQKTPSPLSVRQDGYATRSYPLGGDATGNTTKTKQTKTERTTLNRLATHQDEHDIFLKNKARKKEKQNKTQHNHI